MSRTTPLTGIQQARGAKLVDFNGWTMPVQFAGIVPEHQAVRASCGLFDLGHMGRLRVDGAGAAAFLGRQVCRALTGMADGQVRYGLVLADDGTVEDDVLVSRESPQSWHVVVNAGNASKILDRFRAALPHDARMTDLTAEQAMIAVQGPSAADLLAGLGLDGRALRTYRFADVAWRGSAVRLSRTGYTGEDGFECFAPASRIEELWTAVAGAGATLCGLGARDTLRLEAGMPLYGHELDRTVTPVEAGLAFAVSPQGGFIGAEPVLRQLKDGTAKRLVGLRMLDRRVPRQGYPLQHEGRSVGAVTSGTLSPTLGVPIGMAYVPTALAIAGTRLAVDIRGAVCAAEVVGLPFYTRKR